MSGPLLGDARHEHAAPPYREHVMAICFRCGRQHRERWGLAVAAVVNAHPAARDGYVRSRRRDVNGRARAPCRLCAAWSLSRHCLEDAQINCYGTQDELIGRQLRSDLSQPPDRGDVSEA